MTNLLVEGYIKVNLAGELNFFIVNVSKELHAKSKKSLIVDVVRLDKSICVDKTWVESDVVANLDSKCAYVLSAIYVVIKNNN